MPIFINKNNNIFFKITLTKVHNANIYIYKHFYISVETILNKRFLVFKTQYLYCHELIFCKQVNLQKKDIRMKVRCKFRVSVTGAQLRIFRDRAGFLEQCHTSINTSCATYIRRAPQGKMFVFFCQDTLKIAFLMRI